MVPADNWARTVARCGRYWPVGCGGACIARSRNRDGSTGESVGAAETSVYRLDADVEPHNTASLALLRECGFTREGVLRSYLRFDDGVFDAVLWSLLSSDL